MVYLKAYREILNNGLTVLIQEDTTTPLAVVNLLYKVGSRNEKPERTGFAHLFEHLMFSGSKHAPDFDLLVQMAGGENNAFTNTDVTNYYINLPAANIEIALWLEADRMQHLNIDEQSLHVQRKVVVEEFKQRYLNKPYGDVGHILRSLIYTVHPYRWPTIGLAPEHIEQAQLSDVQDFYDTWYSPNNAILSIAGNVNVEHTLSLIKKYFDPIAPSIIPSIQYPVEPYKTTRVFKEVEREVPSDALYMAFLMPERKHPLFNAYDMISDLMGNGKSSRLYQALVKEKPMFQYINAYVAGTIDRGYLLIEGKIHHQFSLEQAENEVWIILKSMPHQLTEKELEKVNKMSDTYLFHNNTKFDNGDITTTGGRIMSITAVGNRLEDAKSKAYNALENILFEKIRYRKDIGIIKEIV